MGGKAIKVAAMPRRVLLIAISENHTPKKGPVIVPPIIARKALRLRHMRNVYLTRLCKAANPHKIITATKMRMTVAESVEYPPTNP